MTMSQSGASQASGLDVISSPCAVIPAYDCLERASYSGSANVLTPGTVLVNRDIIPGGAPISHLGFFAGGTAAITPTHWWLALLNQGLQVMAVTADQLTAPIGAFSINDLPVTGNINVPGSPSQLQFLYVALMVAAATVPSLESGYSDGAASTPPQMVAYSSTGQTTPPAVGSVLAALTAPSLTTLSSMWAH